MCDCQHFKSVYCILLTSNVNCGLFCIWNDFGNLTKYEIFVLQDHLNAPGEGKRVIQMWKRADDRWQNLKYRQACYPYTVFSTSFWSSIFCQYLSVYFSLCRCLALLFLPLLFSPGVQDSLYQPMNLQQTASAIKHLSGAQILPPALADSSVWTGWT